MEDSNYSLSVAFDVMNLSLKLVIKEFYIGEKRNYCHYVNQFILKRFFEHMISYTVVKSLH